jgi:hypothetical protein
MMRLMTAVCAIAILAGPALADSKKAAPETKATDIHGAPGNTPGFGGSSASPNGNGAGGGNGIHNIGGGAPGQTAEFDPPGQGDPEDRPAGNMHGGLAGATGYSK